MKYHYLNKMWADLDYIHIRNILCNMDSIETAETVLNILQCSTLSDLRKTQESIAQDILAISEGLNRKNSRRRTKHAL